ncbi:MAG TPA: AbrB/MazE/SpoVT family DNA-binding domain-containing protein [Terracidiphilus sp.]|jgi:AbrB family looped-hinge helix DNA binding protein|nr:AbrB/MazE/SpoVT family DNA-binding domain-containing protein [Terracidiphilus sp.]
MKRAYTTVSSKGQMVIPAAIRDHLGIEAGTKVAVTVEGTRVILEPETVAARIRRIEEMRGCTAGLPSGTDLLLEDRRLERERELREEGW